MINCFPILYSDELFYSIVARYQRMCGISSKKALFNDFCNNNERQVFMYLPVHISALINNLPTTSKITEEYIIKNHSMFPYLTSFLNYDRREAVLKEMKYGAKKNPLSICGVSAGSIKFHKYLRYCPECYKEDIELLGESYWRRIHQIPGVFFCLKHNTELINSNIQTNENLNYYICADEIDMRKENDDSINILSNYYKLNSEYIKSVEYLLNNNLSRRKNSIIMDFYLDRLREKELASYNGTIYMKELLKEFKAYFTENYLELMQSNYEIEDESNWLRLFIRKDNKSKSILRHLLILQFLNISVKELSNLNYVEGRKSSAYINIPRLDIEERKKKWLKLIKDNPNATRVELKVIGKGLYSYIYKYQKDWYNEITPIHKRNRRLKSNIDWGKRDNEILIKTKEAVDSIINKPGKPVRVTKTSIKREGRMPSYFKSSNLIKTYNFINEVIEDIDTFRKRKIKWAIKEMQNSNLNITPYQVHIFAGFGEVKDKQIIEIVSDMIDNSLK